MLLTAVLYTAVHIIRLSGHDCYLLTGLNAIPYFIYISFLLFSFASFPIFIVYAICTTSIHLMLYRAKTCFYSISLFLERDARLVCRFITSSCLRVSSVIGRTSRDHTRLLISLAEINS